MPVSPHSPDNDDCQFLTAHGAAVDVRLESRIGERPTLFLLGNRAGLLSVANILLWFVSNAWRREFLSLAELPLIRLHGLLSVTIRLTLSGDTGRDGIISFLDRGEQLEWAVTECDLRRIAIALHGLVAAPHREYFQPWVEDTSAVGIEVRMVDAAAWIERGRA